MTDDARLTTAGSCQLESWTRVYAHSTERWALPACNPGGNLELTFGGAWARSEGQPGTVDGVLQAKTLFKPLSTDSWGWGLAIGRVSHPAVAPGPNALGNTYFYLPVSVSLHADALILHANVGALRDRQTQRTAYTGGLGAEIRLTPRLMGIVESYGDSRQGGYWQTGLRYSLIPDLLQIDATTGQDLRGSAQSRWFSMGLRFTPERLF